MIPKKNFVIYSTVEGNCIGSHPVNNGGWIGLVDYSAQIVLLLVAFGGLWYKRCVRLYLISCGGHPFPLLCQNC